MRKLYTYMVRNANKYGLLTCNSYSWFFKAQSEFRNGKTISVLYISPVIKIEQLFMELFKVMNLAMTDPDPGIDCEPLLAQMPENGPDGNNGGGADRDRSQHRNNKDDNKRKRTDNANTKRRRSNLQNHPVKLVLFISLLKENFLSHS